jgi:hypothetical protein
LPKAQSNSVWHTAYENPGSLPGFFIAVLNALPQSARELEHEMKLSESLRAAAPLTLESGILAAMNYVRAGEGVMPLWAGERDLPTPDCIA